MNNDIYAEWLVKRKKSPLTVPFYIGIVLLFLIGFYVSVISPFGFVALLAAAAAAYFGSARLHVEYEYVFVTNELAAHTQAYEEAGHPENRKNGFHEVT